MKKQVLKILLILSVPFILLSMNCSEAEGDDQLIEIKVTGMTCNHCVQTVTEVLQSVEGVDTAVVDLENDKATVHYKDVEPSHEDMITAITKKGYGAEIVKSD